MFTTKKQVDQHVKTSLAKLRSENEKRLRGLVIAKMYFKIGEYASAQHYVSGYLTTNEAPQAYRLLGDCHCKLKQPEKALASYQRSFQLDNKQTDLLIDACNLILTEDLKGAKANAKFWCEAAGNARIQHESVFNLRLKMLTGDESRDTKQVEEMIVKEINNRPSEVSPRLQLVNYYISKCRAEDAFKYIVDLMTRNPGQFLNSLDWYATVHKALKQYRLTTDVVLSKNWDYWLLSLTSVDRQLALSLSEEHSLSGQQSAHVAQCQQLLFEMDQMLYAAGNISFPVRPELAAQLINHFQGQLLLHAASYLYARERSLNNNQWWTTTTSTMPLLFTAFRIGVASTEDSWLKQTAETTRELMRLWQRQGAFRCAQAGRTLLSCIQQQQQNGGDGERQLSQSPAPFKTPEELTEAARKHCSSRKWTVSLHRQLFASSDEYASKTETSFVATSNLLAEPTFEVPSGLRIQMYERIAESLQCDSLAQLIYLYLHNDKLSECDFNVFPGLELTASNIFNCSAATLNRLDVVTFLIATVMQTRSRLESDSKVVVEGPRPRTLPYANMSRLLCTEEQLRWWQAAYNSTRGVSTEETWNIREVLQDGIEAVRCVGTPKMDLMIALQTGDVLRQKTDSSLALDLATKRAYEQRLENMFQCALYLFKNQSTATVADKRRLFQYSGGNVTGLEVCDALLEGAVIFLAEQHLRGGQYEACIEALANIQLPYATYYTAEAYKKLDESQRNNRTPPRSGSGYQGKVKQFLAQTQKLLASGSKKSHSLRTVVSNELKKMQYSDLNASVQSVDEDSFHLPSSALDRSSSHRQETIVADQVSALTALVTQLTMQNTMLQTEMSDIKKMLQQQKDKESLSESMFLRLEDQQRMSAAYHSPHYDYGRFSMGGFPPMGGGPSPYQTLAPQAHFQNAAPQQFPGHLRGGPVSGLYGQHVDPNASLQAAMVPTYDPVTGTMVGMSPLPPVVGANMPQAYYQPPQPTQPNQAPQNVNVASSLASQLQQPPIPLASSSTVDQAFAGNSILKTWNSTYNNEPVEKVAPANVVITSSDPVPMHNTVTAQKLLSVTIPPQHIKNFGGQVAAPKPIEQPQPFAVFNSHLHSSTLSHTATNISEDETVTEDDLYEQPSGVGGDLGNDSVVVEEEAASAVDKLVFGLREETAAPKSSPFTSFSFGAPAGGVGGVSTANTSPEKPFSSLFGSIAKPTPEKPFQSLFGNLPRPTPTESLFGLNTSNGGQDLREADKAAATEEGGDDEYVPTAQFKPVIELPSLIDVKTGEEDENVAFEHRAKLLRFDPATKEWKERGLGNIRILVKKSDASQVRLLMRREQVLKLACNQRVAKEQVFKKMPNSETALSWYAQDYAENELKTELFAIRFKTSDACQAFHNAILAAQKNMVAGSGVASEPVKAPVDKGEVKKGFGDMFKKQVGSWECDGCLVVNKGDTQYCVACDSPKDSTVPKKDDKPKGLDLSGVKPGQFSFGFGVKKAPVDEPQNLTTKTTTSARKEPEPVKGFGDAFKPKVGSWECQACYITNKGDVATCISCATPKDGQGSPAKDNQSSTSATLLGSGAAAAATGAGSFSFGMGKSTFSFGAQPAAAPAAPTFSNLFNTPAANGPAPAGLFGLPAATTTGTNGPSFGLDSKQTFDFVFKPKSPGKVKSPQKMANGAAGDEEAAGGSDGEEHVEEEESTAYFTPVIPLPEKVEARTGEEDEEVLYSHRAKLFRYTDGEWKERGLGDLKILKHKETSKLRVVMRREQVLKICLNHVLDEAVEYGVKDNKSWHFVANDFSEGVLELMQFSLRFKSPEIATEFKEAVDRALGGGGATSSSSTAAADDTITSEVGADAEEEDEEEQRLIRELKLPQGFFRYKREGNESECSGCRGCDDDSFDFGDSTAEGAEDDDLPLQMPALPRTMGVNKSSGDLAKSIFGGFSQSFSSPTASTSLFGGATMFSGVTKSPTTTIFGGQMQQATNSVETGSPAAATNIFSGLNNSFGKTTTGSVFGSSAPVFGGAASITPIKDSSSTTTTTSTSIFGQKSVFGVNAAAPAIGGAATAFGSFNFGTASQSLSFDKLNADATTTTTTATPMAATVAEGEEVDQQKEAEGNIFKMDSNFSFASLAQQEPGSAFGTTKPEVATGGGGGFFGLSNTNDFRHFSKATNGGGEAEEDSAVDDANYDPHYEPVIALPEEIAVSTGEEDETKIFGERGKLYRYDATNKEWKERGVGEFKILHHAGKGTYRFVMRREQIFKLVLNHAISADFEFKSLDKSGKAFCWATMNHAEQPGVLEQLAVRFKNTDLATKCEEAVKNCISNLQD